MTTTVLQHQRLHLRLLSPCAEKVFAFTDISTNGYKKIFHELTKNVDIMYMVRLF